MSSSDIRVRLRAVLARKRVEEDLNDELAFHLEMQARKNAAEGMCPPEANRLARIQFGVGDTAKEECRDARGVQMFDEFTHDVAYTFRNLRRDAGFTTLAILIEIAGILTALHAIMDTRTPQGAVAWAAVNRAPR